MICKNTESKNGIKNKSLLNNKRITNNYLFYKEFENFLIKKEISFSIAEQLNNLAEKFNKIIHKYLH